MHHPRNVILAPTVVIAAFAIASPLLGERRTDSRSVTISVTLDRGRDTGQAFGSLFEAKSEDGSLTIGAGFQNTYNTRYRADRHSLEVFVRPAKGSRPLSVTPLPRPSGLCGAYLYARDGVVRSTYGGLKTWRKDKSSWSDDQPIGGTEETMRVGRGVLAFGDSVVAFNGKQILGRPARGSYQLFFYANGHLCFYHVERGDGSYRPYKNDQDGFSRLIACPWTPDEKQVDIKRAIKMTLPVVGETTFAWGQLGDRIVTGSNIGGFYVFQNGSWRTLLEPELGVSYQLYSTVALGDRLLLGQYPTGRLFEFDGQRIKELPGWPPKLKDVSGSAREAQTAVVYGGELLVGVWPWAELWRYNPDSERWTFARRMFDHPIPSNKITHPYDVENRGHPVGNLWGQRITSLVTNGPDLFLSTSAKWPCAWEPAKHPFLAPEKWRSYGNVYRLHTPGHLSAVTKWTDGPTTIEVTLKDNQILVHQDGQKLASASMNGELAQRLAGASFGRLRSGEGVYGRFAGKSLEVKLRSSE